MSLCDQLATWSEDRSRKVGAVIVGGANEILSTGYNGLPRGVLGEVDERHSREGGEKYYWFEHAERNAIYNAARSGISLKESRIYASLMPCADCTRAIIQSGIICIITRNPPENDRTYQRSFQISQEMLNEAKVSIRFLSQ